MRIVIIEDEIKAAKELEKILGTSDDTISVVAVIPSIEKGIAWFQTNTADLVFSDIQLADGLSFEIFKVVDLMAPVIFCTAFDEYLMNAFDTNAISYLLKPITAEKVERALEKFASVRSIFERKAQQSGLYNLAKGLTHYKTSLLLYQREKIIPIQVKDIACIYLDKTVLNVITLNQQMYFLSLTMEEVEKLLDPAVFYRANRQFIINRNAVASAERFFARKLVAKLHVKTPENIIVSKARASDFLHWLEG